MKSVATFFGSVLAIWSFVLPAKAQETTPLPAATSIQNVPQGEWGDDSSEDFQKGNLIVAEGMATIDFGCTYIMIRRPLMTDETGTLFKVPGEIRSNTRANEPVVNVEITGSLSQGILELDIIKKDGAGKPQPAEKYHFKQGVVVSDFRCKH